MANLAPEAIRSCTDLSFFRSMSDATTPPTARTNAPRLYPSSEHRAITNLTFEWSSVSEPVWARNARLMAMVSIPRTAAGVLNLSLLLELCCTGGAGIKLGGTEDNSGIIDDRL